MVHLAISTKNETALAHISRISWTTIRLASLQTIYLVDWNVMMTRTKIFLIHGFCEIIACLLRSTWLKVFLALIIAVNSYQISEIFYCNIRIMSNSIQYQTIIQTHTNNIHKYNSRPFRRSVSVSNLLNQLINMVYRFIIFIVHLQYIRSQDFSTFFALIQNSTIWIDVIPI